MKLAGTKLSTHRKSMTSSLKFKLTQLNTLMKKK